MGMYGCTFHWHWNSLFAVPAQCVSHGLGIGTVRSVVSDKCTLRVTTSCAMMWKVVLGACKAVSMGLQLKLALLLGAVGCDQPPRT